MTFLLGDTEPDFAIPAGTEGSAGPSTGFLQNFEAAYREQADVHSAFGADEMMATVEQQQLDKLYSLTGERMAPLFPGTYAGDGPSKQERFAIMHSLAGNTLDAGQQALMGDAQKQMDKYNALANGHGLLTYDQMFKQVQQTAAQEQQTEANTYSTATIGGVVGSFLGGAAGSMTYRDPINLAALALGGPGKTMLARIIADMGLQGVAQVVQLMTGGAENQQLLTGKAPTAGEEAEQVAAGAAGAGVFRGVGEVAVRGFGALAKRFGARAPDIASGALAAEAENVIGSSPYGSSRVAEGMHTADVLDALGKDMPLDQPAPPQMPAGSSPFAASHFATVAADDLFGGTSDPLSRVFDNVPESARPDIDQASKMTAAITSRMDAANKEMAALGDQIKAREGDLLPAKDFADKQAQLKSLNSQIASEANLRKLGQLTRDKNALEEEIGRMQRVNRDLQSLAKQHSDLGEQIDTLRLARAQLVEAAADRAPGVRRSAVVQKLLGGTGEDGVRPIDQRPASNAEEIEKAMAAPQTVEPKAAKVIPPTDEAGKEQVDVGQRSGPVDLDHPIAIGADEDGNPVHTTVRQILQDHADDDALVANMKACLI